jgi:hypothetical protein
MSKKFTNTQRRYFSYELEALGILKALMRWQDDLMGGREFTVITDHKALEYICTEFDVKQARTKGQNRGNIRNLGVRSRHACNLTTPVSLLSLSYQ